MKTLILQCKNYGILIRLMKHTEFCFIQTNIIYVLLVVYCHLKMDIMIYVSESIIYRFYLIR